MGTKFLDVFGCEMDQGSRHAVFQVMGQMMQSSQQLHRMVEEVLVCVNDILYRDMLKTRLKY